mgnify:CR=1 FL=1
MSGHKVTLIEEATIQHQAMEIMKLKQRIAELEERANYNGEQWVKSAEAIIEQGKRIAELEAEATESAAFRLNMATKLRSRIATLEAHIRAIAARWEKSRYNYGNSYLVEEHQSFRDFALEGLEGSKP